MKLAVAFLLSFLALVTQQQRFPYQSRGLFPTTLRDFQFNDVDLYSYLLARRLMQSAYPALPQLDAYASNQNLFNAPQPSIELNQHKLLDIEAKGNSFGRDPAYDQVNPRFFANYATTAGTNSYFNPLLKTVYLFTSSVITTTAVTTCIPATYFVAASSTVACRRRREVLEVLKHISSQGDFEIAPSAVGHIKVKPTADPVSGLGRVDLVSSIDERNIDDSGADSPRSKRFFGGLLYSTTTLTSYVLSTVSSTKTLTTLAATSALSCRPSGYVVC